MNDFVLYHPSCIIHHFCYSYLKLGKEFIVDPTREEAQSCDSAFCISVSSEGRIGSMRKSGPGLLQRSDLTSLLYIAVSTE